MYDTTLPRASNVGGFSITTKFLLVIARLGFTPGDALLNDPLLPTPLLSKDGGATLDTVPHAAHRTLAAPRGYMSVHKHPAHSVYAITVRTGRSRNAVPCKSIGIVAC